jgi:hypothetical protein
MALQSIADGLGYLLTPEIEYIEGTLATQNATIDAAGESVTAIGHIFLSSGPGSSKTISSAGGKVQWYQGTATFANAGTTLRIGVQDVDASGIEDGTFDVYADLVGGTDTITATSINTVPMESGSKTITHGDLIAISIELLSRGGSDVLAIQRGNLSSSMPYFTVDTGSGPQRGVAPPIVSLEFDDGTVGWFVYPAALAESSATFASNSTPDEVALIFEVPFKATATALHLKLGDLGLSDDFEAILYSDPLGTPVAERTITQDMSLASTGARWDRPLTSGFTILPNTTYAIAVRPTTTNPLSYRRLNFGSGNGNSRKATTLGTHWYLATRSDQSGPFGSADTTILPQFGVWLGSLSNDAGGTVMGGARILGGTVVR